MNNLNNPEDKFKPSNCVSHHDDICFVDQDYEDKEDQDQINSSFQKIQQDRGQVKFYD